ncbi:hypothetical protein MSG28_003427 [Choristoneura fumiferana]|uniref:Uncharacterized protein n=1 Tax=Choristoneura fumiferana TaxID=7141 RepID=A0ACC0KFS6_CHOFU|nr:hypothetical protein MSG28_003427 [Choristoneura fumiferana]
MMDGNDLTSETSRKGVISQAWTRLSQIYQGTLDRWTPYARGRWIGTIILLAVFMLRIFAKQHMIKYRYLPFTHSKPKYKTVDPSANVN